MMNDPMGTPFVGGTDSEFPTIANANIIWSDTPDSVAVQAMRAALTDTAYVEKMNSMKMTVPSSVDAPSLIEMYGTYSK